jgi:uncharacterized protein (TIGR04141 family)
MREVKHKFAIYKIEDAVSCTQNLMEYGFVEIECRDPKYMLYMTKKVKKPKWERILLQVADDPTKIEASNETSSFVLLRTIGDNVYAFTGGIGFFSIQNYIVQDYGIDLISKIIDPDRIKYIKQKPLAGKTVQEEHVFKEYYNYEFDPYNWGKISKEILGEIKDTDLKNDLGIDITGKFKIRLQGKSSFTINRSITLDQLDTVLERLEELSLKEDKFRLYKGFSEVTNRDRKNTLSAILIQNLISLYKGYRDKEYDVVESDVIISYADAREFILSDYYVLSYKNDSITLTELSLEHVFDFLIDLGIDEFDESYLSMIKIAGFNSEDEMRYMDKLKTFLVADVVEKKTNYCYIDQKWFEVSKDLIEIANEEVCKVLENYIIDEFKLPKWKHASKKLETEDSYIPRVCSGNLVQMHRNHIHIKGQDKAEVCDIVDLRKDGTLFIFVKRGLGTSLRELFAQARNSMELYYKDGQFRSDSLEKIKEKTLQSFDEHKVGVILAYTDHILKRDDTSLVEKISTVVKLDLIQTFRFLDGIGIKNIMLYEIPHE